MRKSGKKIVWIIALSLTGLFFLLLSSISIKSRIAMSQSPLPQAILVLGGGPDREIAAAQLAATYPDFEVWISSGDGRPGVVEAIFAEAGVARDRIHLDFRATDTVTNFTTLVEEFQQRDIHHLYLVTSDFHMARAKTIATLVLGHSGITFTPVPTTTERSRESWLRIARDGGRSLLWIATGRTGARIGRAMRANKKDDQ